MSSKTWAFILKIPLLVFAVVSFVVSFIAALVGVQEVDWFSPIFLGILLVSYLGGYLIGRKK